MSKKNQHATAVLLAALIFALAMACASSSTTGDPNAPGTTTTSGPTGMGTGDQPSSIPTPSEPTDTAGTDPNEIAPPPTR